MVRDALDLGSIYRCVREWTHPLGILPVCHFQSATDHLIDLYEMFSGLIPEGSIYDRISTEGKNADL